MSTPALAFAAGVLTIVSPCVLPVLPALLGGALVPGARSRPLFIALGFVLAFSAAAALLVGVPRLLGVPVEWLRDVAAIVLLGFGLGMLWPAGWASLAGRAPSIALTKSPGSASALLLGASLGLVWAPCAGPVLGAMLGLVMTESQPARAAGLLALYASGAALPMLLIAYGGQRVVAGARSLARHAAALRQAFGALIVLTALLIFFQLDTQVVAWLSRLYPAAWQGVL